MKREGIVFHFVRHFLRTRRRSDGNGCLDCRYGLALGVYHFGLIGVILAWIWHRYACDNPKDSPYVNEAEARYINEGRSEDSMKKEVAPWRTFLRSSQFWAVGIQFMVVDYIMYVFLAWLPLYLTEVHNLSLKSMGVWASFPWIALMAMVFVAGYVSDHLANGKMQNANIRCVR